MRWPLKVIFHAVVDGSSRLAAVTDADSERPGAMV
jgi:hypothetical protein